MLYLCPIVLAKICISYIAEYVKHSQARWRAYFAGPMVGTFGPVAGPFGESNGGHI